MNATELRMLAEWLFGTEANAYRVDSMIERWQKNPSAAQRWAEVRDLEQRRQAAKEGAR